MLIPLALAVERYGLPANTVKRLVRQNLVAGMPNKPFMVDEFGLIEYIQEQGNDKLRTIYTGVVPVGHGGVSLKGT